MRELALTGGDGLDTADADVTAFAADCRFRDCAHAPNPAAWWARRSSAARWTPPG
jgi:putative ribosome biogenesis GTPase RsgA